MNDRYTRECTHPEARHLHGTAQAYRHDKCRCRPCTTANSRAADHRNREIAYGTYTAGRVDATAARDHLRVLRKAGITPTQISRITGLSRDSVTGISAGRQVTCMQSTAIKILAVEPDPILYANPLHIVDGTGTARRLQALVAIGYTQGYLAHRLYMHPQNFQPILRGETMVRVRTALATRDLYDELWKSPQTGTKALRARNIAEQNHWVSPLAWDDDQLDNPHAKPTGLPTNRKHQARPASMEDVEHLIRSGVGIDEVLRRTGYNSASSLITRLERGKRRDLLEIVRSARSIYSDAAGIPA